MEKFLPFFPRYGKSISTVWKNGFTRVGIGNIYQENRKEQENRGAREMRYQGEREDAKITNAGE